MRQLSAALVIVFAILIPTTRGAYAQSQRPTWVDGNPGEKYPEQRYLTAVGSGNSREAANQDAKKQLASTFRAKITSDSSSESSASLSESTNAKTSGEGSAKIRTSVSVSTNLELRGVEVKNYYYDAKSKEHYALAVMDKLKVKNSYNLELAKLKTKAEALQEKFSAKASSSTGREILETMEQFDSLNREYEVVNNGQGMAAPLSFAQLEKIREQMEGLQSTKAVALEFTGEGDSPEFQEMITSCLADKSIGVVTKIESVKEPEYHVMYNLREKQKFMQVKDWVKFEFSSLAVVKKNNVLVDRKRYSKEASGRTRENAFDSIKDELSESICSQIAKVVTK